MGNLEYFAYVKIQRVIPYQVIKSKLSHHFNLNGVDFLIFEMFMYKKHKYEKIIFISSSFC